jgi:16S rRNA processing protein RimM
VNKNPPDPWVLIGRIGKPVGLHGAIRVWSEAELESIFEKQAPLFLWDEEGEPETPLPLEGVSRDGKSWVVQVGGVESRETAAELIHLLVVANREDLPAPEQGSVYWSDLIDAEVATKAGEVVGKIREPIDTPSHTLLEIETADGEVFLVPLTEEVDADLEMGKTPDGRNRVSIHLPEGMREATTVEKETDAKPPKKRLRLRRGKRK